MTFRDGNIDYRVEHPDGSGELPAWIKSEPWCGQTVFVFPVMRGSEVEEPHASICETARGVFDQVSGTEKGARFEWSQVPGAKIGNCAAPTLQCEVSALAAMAGESPSMEETTASTETVKPLEDRTEEEESGGESEV